MGITIQMYDDAQVKGGAELEPGDIIEAMPGSNVTRAFSQPREGAIAPGDPTGVFCYVSGICESDLAHKILGAARVVGLRHPADEAYDVFLQIGKPPKTYLDWFSESGSYRVVGSIGGAPSLTREADHYRPGAVEITTDDHAVLTRTLESYVREREARAHVR